jgi:hypothetical protein
MGQEIVLVNGPPRSGKDTLASELSRRLKYTPVKFASPLYNTVQAMFGLDPDLWAALYERYKEQPSPLLEGLSPRQAMIWVSEKIVKPTFGDSFYGRALYNRLVYFNISRAIVSDSGFQEEAGVLLHLLGKQAIRLIRLHRSGTSFHGDSRGYISLDVPCLDLVNDGEIDEMVDHAIRWLEASE